MVTLWLWSLNSFPHKKILAFLIFFFFLMKGTCGKGECYTENHQPLWGSDRGEGRQREREG